MTITWILVANSTTARIYSLNKINKLNLVTELNHPDGRKKDTELVSGELGRYKARSGAASGNFSSKSEPKKVEADNFAKEIAEVLDHGRRVNDFDSVVLISPPNFHGLLNKHLDTHLQQKISRVISKNYHAANEEELIEIVRASRQIR